MLGGYLERRGNIYSRTLWPEIYTNKTKRNLFAYFRMADHVLYEMAPCFGHTGVTFDVENDRPVPGSLKVILRPPEAVF